MLLLACGNNVSTRHLVASEFGHADSSPKAALMTMHIK